MEVQAISKSVRISPRKIRLVADSIRNKRVDSALAILASLQQQAARPITKTLKSAIANAVNNAGLDRNSLMVSTVMANQGQVLKRFRPSTRGRIHPYKKRSTNLTIMVKSVSADEPVSVPAVQEAEIVAEKKEVKGGKTSKK